MSDGKGAALETGLATSWASVSPSARILLPPSAAKMGKGNPAASRTVREAQSTKTTMVQLAGSLQEIYL